MTPAAALLAALLAGADPREFLDAHCAGCHGGTKPKAGLDLAALAGGFDDPARAAVWERVHDKTASGEMPPKSSDQPEPAERAAFVKDLAGRLHAASRARQEADGRVVVRRLNRTEYEHTLRDLLGGPVRVRHLLPDDPTAAGFDTVSAALDVSPTLLVRYQEAADAALDQAVTSAPRRVNTDAFTGREWYERARKHYEKYDRTGERFPFQIAAAARVEGDAVWVYEQAGHHSMLEFAPAEPPGRPGVYRVRVTAEGRNSGGRPVPVLFFWQHVRADQELSHLIAARDAPADRPAAIEFTVEVRPDRAGNRIAMRGMTLAHQPGDAKQVKGPRAKEANGPALVVHRFEVEGPVGDWPSPGYRLLFGDLPAEPLSWAKLRAEGKPVPKNQDWQKWHPNEFHSKPLVPIPNDPKADAERLVRAFLPRAFRRPVEPALADTFVRFAHDRIDRGVPFAEAVRAAVKAALCSPHFLFLVEPPGRLDDYALASRLSYFLWKSMPDGELLRLAAAGRLRDPAVLRAQADRLLADPKSARFTDDFPDQWLDVKRALAMKPDGLYREYDDLLGWSLAPETRLVFAEMVRGDRPVTEFVRSDWTFLNERLAKHYAVPGVHGAEFRKVALKPEWHRGGVLTHASVLKVTANGSYTSPVKRGAWLLERIVGRPADPPPPDVPAVQPDIRGATTLREQIEKHRSAAACAGCHAKIDPPGFALESYDVTGAWRERYRTPGPLASKSVKAALPGYPDVEVWLTAPVETAGVTAAGERFADVEGYKDVLLRDPDQLARTVARKLLVYATGADLLFGDRADLEAIVAAVRSRNRGLRSIIQEVVASRPFGIK